MGPPLYFKFNRGRGLQQHKNFRVEPVERLELISNKRAVSTTCFIPHGVSHPPGCSMMHARIHGNNRPRGAVGIAALLGLTDYQQADKNKKVARIHGKSHSSAAWTLLPVSSKLLLAMLPKPPKTRVFFAISITARGPFLVFKMKKNAGAQKWLF